MGIPRRVQDGREVGQGGVPSELKNVVNYARYYENMQKVIFSYLQVLTFEQKQLSVPAGHRRR